MQKFIEGKCQVLFSFDLVYIDIQYSVLLISLLSCRLKGMVMLLVPAITREQMKKNLVYRGRLIQ